MRRHAKLVGLGSVLTTIAGVVHGCKEPTQVTVDVRTNVVCADLRGVDVVAAFDARRAEQRAALVTEGPRFPSGTTTACVEGPPPRHVGTLVVTPDGSGGAVVVIAAFGDTKVADCVAPTLPPRCIIARRRFSFIENRKITMPVLLDPDCAGIPCNENSTCVGKRCVDSAVDCTGDQCTEPGVAADGGIIEVDAFSPLVDGAPPPDDGSVPSDGAPPNDGGGQDGSSSDGGDAGDPDSGSVFDAGANATCPGVASCVGYNNQNTVCMPAPGKCCYGGGVVGCTPTTNKLPCAGLTACCHGSTPCPVGTVCCPDSPMPTDTTVIACRPIGECKGPRICSNDDTNCSGMGECQTSFVYSEEPDYPNYFGCS
jgi:hypothetical protein